MKKILLAALLFACAPMLDARVAKAPKRPFFELGAKANAFLGEDDFLAGVGAEAVINPASMLGIRYELFDGRFGGGAVSLSLLEISSLDAFLYLPMAGLDPYIHCGAGISTSFGSGASAWAYGFRGGMGFDYPVSKNLRIFAEPGIAIGRVAGVGTQTVFRLSAGARMGMLK